MTPSRTVSKPRVSGKTGRLARTMPPMSDAVAPGSSKVNAGFEIGEALRILERFSLL
jgi:hypothetical protein